VRGGASFHLPTGDADCGGCHRTTEDEPIVEQAPDGTLSITAAGRAAHVDGCVEVGRGTCTR
jgi:hypothetical protein